MGCRVRYRLDQAQHRRQVRRRGQQSISRGASICGVAGGVAARGVGIDVGGDGHGEVVDAPVL
jgi:hypothetical protein